MKMATIDELTRQRNIAVARKDNTLALKISREIDALQRELNTPKVPKTPKPIGEMDYIGQAKRNELKTGEEGAVAHLPRKDGEMPDLSLSPAEPDDSLGIAIVQAPEPAAIPVAAGPVKTKAPKNSVPLETWEHALDKRNEALDRLKIDYPRICAEMRELVRLIAEADGLADAVNRALPPNKPEILPVEYKLRKEKGADLRIKTSLKNKVRLPNLLGSTPKECLFNAKSFISSEIYE